MTTLHILDLSNKKRVVTGRMRIYHPSYNMRDGTFHQRYAMFVNEGDFQSIHRATPKMAAQPLLILGEDTYTVKAVGAKQLEHLGMMPDGDQHQGWIQGN